MMSQENRKGLDETVLKEQSAQEKQEAEHATWENANTTWSGTGDTWEDIKPKRQFSLRGILNPIF